jgi:alpha-amylase/alpha-mannosidase (GH57 family)
MTRVTLCLIVHDHQPIGNFDEVFRAATRDAYAPFLAFLERHPALRIAHHTSGPLLQWLARHEPDLLARRRRLVERGQVELWGGGFFEPILTAIPEVDRRGQIRAMADWLELELASSPRTRAGAWPCCRSTASCATWFPSASRSRSWPGSARSPRGARGASRSWATTARSSASGPCARPPR